MLYWTKCVEYEDPNVSVMGPKWRAFSLTNHTFLRMRSNAVRVNGSCTA